MVCPAAEKILSGYRIKIFRPECNPNFQSVHCIADLDNDVRAVLPYLNTVLGGNTYTQNPPAVTFKAHGKLITVHSQQIAINALRDKEEAEKILRWLAEEINRTWEERARIKPNFQGISRPQVLEILNLLPRNNCRRCGQATCTVFSVLLSDGAKGPEDCPGLTESCRNLLQNYLARFPPGP
jgi:ArsR family metal-binding transcriptional regulator